MIYNNHDLFTAKIVDRYTLTRGPSEKTTFHLSIDLEGSGVCYEAGDSFALLAPNPPEIVDKTLEYLGLGSSVEISNTPLRDILTYHVDLSKVTSKLFQYLLDSQDESSRIRKHTDVDKRDFLADFFVWDFLKEFRENILDANTFCGTLSKMLPRFYSIASSQHVIGNRVDLIVALTHYESRGIQRFGLCSQYLYEHAPLGKPCIPLYLQKSKDFHLPCDGATDIIMVGPGTGVAPFRGFMQERLARGDSGRNWLFFGEQYSEGNFYYRDFWEACVEKGKLHLHTAFSRDSNKKMYVQDRMLEQAAILWPVLEGGGILYVCGDASKMAKDVDSTLHRLIQEQGNMDEATAHSYIRQMRKEKRYLRDIY